MLSSRYSCQAALQTPFGVRREGLSRRDVTMQVKPFRIAVSQAGLDDLRERLARTRWPDEVSGAGWDYGANLAYMRELIAYWQKGYDWRAQERAMNAFAHFRAEVDGLGTHFIRERRPFR